MSLPPVYLATINVPGYLPMADEPAWAESVRGAWGYLLGERENSEESAAESEGPWSDTVLTLRALASEDVLPGDPLSDGVTDDDLCGVVYGPTPGYDGEHDLGLAYVVARVEHSEYPHPAGYMTNCPGCLARCYCDGEGAACVYLGEHS